MEGSRKHQNATRETLTRAASYRMRLAARLFLLDETHPGVTDQIVPGQTGGRAEEIWIFNFC
jgi:hypothetical protein